MTLRFLPALDEDVRVVARGMRQSDVDEFLAVSPARDREELAQSLLDRFGGHPAAIAVHDDAGPVCIGAGIEGRPNVVTLLFFATDRFPAAAIGVARFATRQLFPAYRRAGAHRIEAVSIDGYDEAHRWIGLLGLKHEATMPGYGKNGQTFHQFAWVADDVRSPGA